MVPRPFLLLLAVSAFALGCGSNDDPPQEVPDPELSTIQQARGAPLGQLVKIEGFVSVAPGTFASSTGDRGFALQDETGGLYVNLYDKVTAPLGTKLTVLGTMSSVAGQSLLVTNLSGVTVGEGSSPVTPKAATTGNVGEATEGLLLRVTGKVTKMLVSNKPFDVHSFIDDGSGEVKIFVNILSNDSPLIDTTKLVVDATIEITGFSQQYGDDYELAPRTATDLVVVP